MQETTLIKRSDVLGEDCIPKTIKFREKELNKLRMCLKSIRQKRRPLSAWLYGKPGTGKTITAKYFLNEIRKTSSVTCFYINCYEQRTYHGIVDKILHDTGHIIAMAHTTLKVAKLQEVISNRPAIVVLDEIDKLTNHDREEILYCLTNFKNVSIVSISKFGYTARSLDPRIISRLNVIYVPFETYTQDEMVELLKDKARQAMTANTWRNEDIEKIASFAEGDMRTALQLLEKSTLMAEMGNEKAINTTLIESAFMEMKTLDRQYILNSFTRHHRILFDIIKDNSGVRTGALWRLYCDECKSRHIPVCSFTSFHRYLREMRTEYLITIDRALGRGFSRIFKPVVCFQTCHLRNAG